MPELYDLMLLIDASAPDDRRNEIVAETEGLIEQGGTILGRHDWGTRKITFEIDHHPEADYRLWQFEAGNDVLDKLNHSLKITDGILRFRIIRQGAGAPPVPPAPDPVRVPRAEEADGRVAARAAADAPAEPAEAEAAPAETASVDATPVEAAPEPAEAPEPEDAPEADAPAPSEA
jgi:ribosomal protein S6